MAQRQLTPQEQSRVNDGQAVVNPDGSLWRRGVLVSAGDAARSAKTRAQNEVYAAQGGQKPDRTRDPRAEGEMAQARYEANPIKFVAEGWDGQPLAPVQQKPNSQDRGQAAVEDWISPVKRPAPEAKGPAMADMTSPASGMRVDMLPTMQLAAEGGYILPPNTVVPPNYEWLAQPALTPAQKNAMLVNSTVARIMGREPAQPTSGGTITRNGKVTTVPPSFAGGGYTGPGDKLQPAGIVHAGEFVIPKEKVEEIGVPALDAYFETDSTKPKYGFVEGGAPLDLSSVRLPRGVTIPEQVRQAAIRLSQLGGKSNKEIINALENQQRGWDAIVGEAGNAETRYRQDEAQTKYSKAKEDFDRLYQTKFTAYNDDFTKAEMAFNSLKDKYAQDTAGVENKVTEDLAKKLREMAADPTRRKLLSAKTYRKEIDPATNFERTVEEPGLDLPDPKDAARVAELEGIDPYKSAATLILQGGGGKNATIAGMSKTAMEQLKRETDSLNKSYTAEAALLTAAQKLTQDPTRLQRDPELVRAGRALEFAQKNAERLGSPLPQIGSQGGPAASRISEEESRATSFAGGPGAYFSPYVVDPNTGLPKKFATLEEARSAATGKAPAPAAPLAEFMAPAQSGVFTPGESMFPETSAPTIPQARIDAVNRALGGPEFPPAPVATPQNPIPPSAGYYGQGGGAEPAAQSPRTYADVAAALTPVVPSSGVTSDTSGNYGQRNLDSLAATWRQVSRPFTQELTPKDPVLDRISALDYQMGAYSDKSSPRYQALVAERNQLMASRSAPKQESPIEGPTPEFYGPQQSPIMPSGPADVGSAAGRGFSQGPYENPIVAPVESPIEGPTPEFYGPQQSPIAYAGPSDVGSAAGRGLGLGPYENPIVAQSDGRPVTVTSPQLAAFGKTVGGTAPDSNAVAMSILARERAKKYPAVPVPTYEFGWDQGLGSTLNRIPNRTTVGQPILGFWGPQS